eukprot:CAMPEP_0172326428 /NCGR_PEP_ID=MMETSP1058-20130122/56501_1 /TAXON_ID=83371 /ORGANISM="Detonula confervacea, Strain CCMP 353" /LENGTH=318 /DNA_ID=CAMNT_0013043205 /DNA_START=35 /DNA_END=988 /DNA_ORIENTATION=+
MWSAAAATDTPECVDVGRSDTPIYLNSGSDSPVVKRNLDPSFIAVVDDILQESVEVEDQEHEPDSADAHSGRGNTLKPDDGRWRQRGNSYVWEKIQKQNSLFARVVEASETMQSNITEEQLAPDPARIKDAVNKARVPCRAPRTIIIFFAMTLISMRLVFQETGYPDIRLDTVGIAATGGVHPTIGPFGGGSVFVIQAADEAYAAKKKSMMEANQQWASCMNYTYELKTFIKEGNPYTGKVRAIRNALEAAKENDWIIFLDGDVQFQANSCDALEKMLPLSSKADNEPCEFIATTTPQTIGTGVLLLKSVSATKHLVW